MKICENCGDEHDGTYGSGRFCSQKCSRSFSTKKKRKEINKKVSETLKKKKYCISCGIEINEKRKKYCNECHSLYKNKILFKKLNILENNLKKSNENALKILKKEYFDNKLSKDLIFKKYNIRSNTLYNFFKKNNIKLRTIGEANVLALLENRAILNKSLHNFYKQGWHKTWDGKKVFLRSSYEFKFAKELDENKILYEVEKLRISYYDTEQKKLRVAIPDFYLPKENLIIEIKSDYTYNKKEMNDKFIKYKQLGYKAKLIFY